MASLARWIAYPVFAAVAVGSALNAIADEAESKRAIARVLEIGWSTAPQARTAADMQFSETATITGADMRLLRAWTFVLLYQRRYDEASRRVEQWLAREEHDPVALRLRIWLSTLLKDYPAAMVSAEKLAEVTFTDESPEEHKERGDEITAFLGRIFGFLGGPASSAVNQDDRKAHERKVVALLGEQRQAIFEESRDGVLQQFLELTDSKAEERDRAREKEEERREKSLQDIDSERQTMAKRADEIKDQRDKLRSELNDELAEIMKLDQPLVTALARLESQAASLNRELGSLTLRLNGLEAEAAREEDPIRRDRFLREADRMRIIGSRVEFDLRGLQREANVVQTQRVGLARRQQAAQNNLGGQIARLDKESGEMQKREKRLAADENRANRPISSTTSKALALSATASALTSYDTLPLEESRQKLLEELK